MRSTVIAAAARATASATTSAATPATVSRVKLLYLDGIRGRAEPIRLALVLGNIPFEDTRVSYKQVGEMRKTLPFGQVPVAEIDGELFGQSSAILNWAGQLAGRLASWPADQPAGWPAGWLACWQPAKQLIGWQPTN